MPAFDATVIEVVRLLMEPTRVVSRCSPTWTIGKASLMLMVDVTVPLAGMFSGVLVE